MAKNHPVFVHAKCGKQFVKNAICSGCGEIIKLAEILAYDQTNGSRPVMPSDLEWYVAERNRYYPAFAIKLKRTVISEV